MGVGSCDYNVTAATNKTHSSDSVVLAREETKKSTLSHVLKGEK